MFYFVLSVIVVTSLTSAATHYQNEIASASDTDIICLIQRLFAPRVTSKVVCIVLLSISAKYDYMPGTRFFVRTGKFWPRLVMFLSFGINLSLDCS